MPQNVLQSLKKQCNPLLKKSFKERNPDVDMDEIQNNPNVPEDVKAAITGALTLTLDEDDGTEENETGEEELPPVDGLETFDDDYIMDMSEDDGKKSRRRRIDENDEDWLTGRYKVGKPKRSKRKKKHSKKHHHHHRSEDGENAKQTAGDKEKVKKKRSRKSNDANQSMDNALNANALDRPNDSSTLNNSTTVNSTNTSFSGYEHLNSSHELTNGILLNDSSGYDSMRKENKQKKTPKKRDSMDKSMNGIVKKQSRRQFTSISAIMACIESVVQGTDVSIPESTSEIAVKTEHIENNEPFKTADTFSSMNPAIKVEHMKIEGDNNVIKPKKKPRRKSTTAIAKATSTTTTTTAAATAAATVKRKQIQPQRGKSDQTAFDSKPIIKKTPINGAPVKPTRTSMKKVKFLS